MAQNIMTQEEINNILIKMQGMNTNDDGYEILWLAVINHYNRMIHGLIKNTGQKQDFYNDCVLHLPKIINDWNPNIASFGTHLTVRLRGFIQTLREKDTLILFNKRTEKYTAKKKGIAERTISILSTDSEKNRDSKIVSQKYNRLEVFMKSNTENDIDMNTCMNIIKRVDGGDDWIQHYIEGYSIYEMSRINNITYFVLHRQIKKADKIIKAKMKKLLMP